MYFIVEKEEQLERLQPDSTCFIQVIPYNDEYHPGLTRASLVYYRNSDKGYIFSINHSEGFSLSIQSVNRFLNGHSKVYLLDLKFHSYFLDLSNAVDIFFTQLDKDNETTELDCYTKLHTDFYRQYSQLKDVNKIIPITKHYERCECMYSKVKRYIDLEIDTEHQNEIVKAYKKVEEVGIGIDSKQFSEIYQPKDVNASVANGTIYTSYNLYNITARPTNAFNGINFLAIPKDEKHRTCFIPKNDYFVEFDFDAYHLRLIAKLIDYTFSDNKESIHTQLAKQYFNTSTITDDQYKESKVISFRQLYGGIESQYKHIDFFNHLNQFIDDQWNAYKRSGAIILPTGRIFRTIKGMNKLKLFNYIIQNMETKENVKKINEIHDLIEENKYISRLVLITYDSFLLDYSISDGKEALINIKNKLQGSEEDFMLVKHKYGKDYFFKH